MGLPDYIFKSVLSEIPSEGIALILLCVLFFGFILLSLILNNMFLLIMGILATAALAILAFLTYQVIMKNKAGANYAIVFIAIIILLPFVHPQQVPGMLDFPTKGDLDTLESNIIENQDTKYNDIDARLRVLEETKTEEETTEDFDIFLLIPIALLQILNTLMVLFAFRMWR